MTTIKGIVLKGRIEVTDPIDLPDGTELAIAIPDQSTGDSIHDDTPAAIAAWLRWYDSMEPLEFTDAERAAWDAARREQKELELSHWEQRSQGIEGRFA